MRMKHTVSGLRAGLYNQGMTPRWTVPLLLVPMLAAQDAVDLHRRAFVMDGHVHVMSRELLEGRKFGDAYPDGSVDLPRIIKGGLDAIFFSVYTPEPYYAPRHEVKHTFRVVQLAVEEIERNHNKIELARTAADIERINRAGKVAALLDLEGGFDLDGDLLILRALHRLGLRSVQLTAHNYTNNFADSCCDERKFGGLNEHGRKVIKEMNRIGMIVNVAHASEETILQTVELSDDPVLFTHGGFRHFIDIPRCISDKAAKAVAAKGGVVGIQFGNTFNNPKYFEWTKRRAPARNISASLERYKSMSIQEIDAEQLRGIPFVFKGMIPDDIRMHTDQLARVIDYGVKLLGEDHMALGSDFDGGPPLPHEIKDIADYPEMTKALMRLGYNEQRIRKILGLNLLRVIREVTDK
ncbi:MAG: membrane dipeptidase [Bryobacterales bacterium]|nr:membrane dipeptidase [Bryobacterales bacterium]